jgi:hypothetical protein
MDPETCQVSFQLLVVLDSFGYLAHPTVVVKFRSARMESGYPPRSAVTVILGSSPRCTGGAASADGERNYLPRFQEQQADEFRLLAPLNRRHRAFTLTNTGEHRRSTHSMTTRSARKADSLHFHFVFPLWFSGGFVYIFCNEDDDGFEDFAKMGPRS